MFPRRRRRGAFLVASAGAAISRESILFVLFARGRKAAATAHLVPDGGDGRVLIGPRVFHRPEKEEFLPRVHPFA